MSVRQFLQLLEKSYCPVSLRGFNFTLRIAQEILLPIYSRESTQKEFLSVYLERLLAVSGR